VEVRLRAQDRAELDAWARATMGDDPRHAERAWYETTRATLEERGREVEAWQRATLDHLAELVGRRPAERVVALLPDWDGTHEQLLSVAEELG
jgi:hypothetical protein